MCVGCMCLLAHTTKSNVGSKCISISLHGKVEDFGSLLTLLLHPAWKCCKDGAYYVSIVNNDKPMDRKLISNLVKGPIDVIGN